VEHELQMGVFQANPPVGRLDAGDGLGLACGGHAEEEGGKDDVEVHEVKLGNGGRFFRKRFLLILIQCMRSMYLSSKKRRSLDIFCNNGFCSKHCRNDFYPKKRRSLDTFCNNGL